jgi:hypothetical protein
MTVALSRHRHSVAADSNVICGDVQSIGGFDRHLRRRSIRLSSTVLMTKGEN